MEISIRFTQDPVVIPPAALPSREIGACLEFQGIVRETEGELALAGLRYEAHEPMAVLHLERIFNELSAAHPCAAVTFIHRLGWVPVGEASLFVRVLAAHRGPALRFMADAIDRMKADAPIWKSEIGEQSRWMNREATARGFKSVTDLARRDLEQFKRMGAQWRAFHARYEAGNSLQDEGANAINRYLYGSQESHPGTHPNERCGGRLAGTSAALRNAAAVVGGGERTSGSLTGGGGENTAESPTVRAAGLHLDGSYIGMDRILREYPHPSQHPQIAEALRQKTALAQWAQAEEIAISRLPVRFDPASASNKGQGETDAWYDEDSGRWVKATNTGGTLMGKIPMIDPYGGISFTHGTIAQYLARLDDHNQTFGDNIRLHAVLLDGQTVKVITSQPDIAGKVPEGRFVEREMDYAGFKRFGDGMYYRASDNHAAVDLDPSNAFNVGDVLVPIDEVLFHPTGEMLKKINAKIGMTSDE